MASAPEESLAVFMRQVRTNTYSNYAACRGGFSAECTGNLSR